MSGVEEVLGGASAGAGGGAGAAGTASAGAGAGAGVGAGAGAGGLGTLATGGVGYGAASGGALAEVGGAGTLASGGTGVGLTSGGGLVSAPGAAATFGGAAQAPGLLSSIGSGAVNLAKQAGQYAKDNPVKTLSGSANAYKQLRDELKGGPLAPAPQMSKPAPVAPPQFGGGGAVLTPAQRLAAVFGSGRQ